MLRNGDWGNLALRCEEAKTLKRRALERAQGKRTPIPVAEKRQPSEWSAQERRASALGLVQFKLRRGEVEGARAIARQVGIDLPADMLAKEMSAA